MHFNGQGTPQDFALALSWFRPTAKQGYAATQRNLRVMHGNGYATPQDYLRAHKRLNLTGWLGNKVSGEQRGSFAKLMTPQQMGQAQKMACGYLAKNNKRYD